MSAVIDGVYRYSLTRNVLFYGSGDIVFVMLNPSTADATTNDPTIRRCISFTAKQRAKRLVVVNLFAFRSPNPQEMLAQPDPVGPMNDEMILDAVRGARMVIAAWGAATNARVAKRSREVLSMLAKECDVYALALTKDGHPRHPLYLPDSCVPTMFKKRS